MNTESEKPENLQPAEETPAAPQVQQEPRGFDPRRRLRELLSVPERDRTDAQWDEINELEIQLAPGNRVSPGHHAGLSDKPVGNGGGRPFQPKKHSSKGGGKRRPRPPGNNPNNQNKPQQ